MRRDSRVLNKRNTLRTEAVDVIQTEFFGYVGVVAAFSVDAEALVVVPAGLQHMFILAVFFPALAARLHH